MKIITTVGTSLIDNYLSAQAIAENNLTQLPHQCDIEEGREVKGKKEEAVLNKLADFFNGFKKEGKGWQKKWKMSNGLNEDASAEIKSIIKIANGQQAEVYLLHTDTEASRLSALGVKKFFEEMENFKKKISIKDAIRIKGLQIEEPEKFTEGAINLFKAINDLKGNSEDAILNISGGYKAMIPIGTIISQLNGIPAKYIYEDSDEVIEIPGFGLEFNYAGFEEYIELIKGINNPKTPSTWINQFSEESFDTLLKLGLIVRNEGDDCKWHLTTYGAILLEYFNDYRSERDKKPSIWAQLMEMAVFKYFVQKYPEGKVEHGKQDSFEYDVFIEKKEGDIIGVEVKPGGNVPIWERNNNKRKEKDGTKSIEHKLHSGGFKHLIDRYGAEKTDLRIYLYRSIMIDQPVINQIEKLHKKYPEQTKNLKWYWFKTPSEYKWLKPIQPHQIYPSSD